MFFGLAGAAVGAWLDAGMASPWSATLIAGGALADVLLVPYGAPAFAWLLSTSKLWLLDRPLQWRIAQSQRRMIAKAQKIQAEVTKAA